jgi:hypothetical protein
MPSLDGSDLKGLGAGRWEVTTASVQLEEQPLERTALPVLKGKCILTHADCNCSVIEFNICNLFGVLTACFAGHW